MLRTKEEIIGWLNDYGVRNYTINDDLTIDVSVKVDLGNKKLTEIPVQFNVVNGDFNCSNNRLVNLKGCPRIVKGSFACAFNQLLTLSGGPEVVNGLYTCSSNQLINLIGSPQKITNDFFCNNNNLESLIGCPSYISGVFDASNNFLKKVDAEFTTKAEFIITNNDITLDEFLVDIKFKEIHLDKKALPMKDISFLGFNLDGFDLILDYTRFNMLLIKSKLDKKLIDKNFNFSEIKSKKI